MPRPSAPRAPAASAATATALCALVVLAACAGPFPSPSATGLASPSTPTPTPSASPTPTAEPPLSLALPSGRDERRIGVSVTPAVPATGTGRFTVMVTSLADTRIGEIVLRWSSQLDAVVFLSPFQPSARRLTDALIQPWTRWVVGPGEQGEPAGTTSLGWGPLLPRATMTIPLFATRKVAGPVSFDLQFLAGEKLLSTSDGRPAEIRVTIP